jgi:hypothetical protein
MLANAAVEYTYELKYLRPFHFDKSFIKSQSQHATKFNKGT